MSSFEWPPQSGSGSGVSSVNTLTGSITLAAGSGISLTPSGNTITIAATGTSGANTALSNLASVAFNVDLVPGSSNARNLGSSSALMANVFLGSGGNGIVLQNGISTYGYLFPNNTTPSGATNVPALFGAGGGTLSSVGLYTSSDSTANSTATGNVLIESGNKTAGTGGSGNIALTVGTSSGGTQGSIKLLKNGVASVVGQVWTATGTDGSGYWSTNTGGATNSYWSGFHNTNQTWSTTSNTFADPTAGGGTSITARVSNGITVSAGAGTVPGIQFSPSTSAVYLITAVICMAAITGVAAGVRLIDSNGVVLCQVGFTYQATAFQPIVTLSGVYVPATTSAVTVKIQLLSDGTNPVSIGTPTTAVAVNPIEWTLVRIA